MPSRAKSLQKGRWRFDDHAMKRRQRQEMLGVASDEHVAPTDERRFKYEAVLDVNRPGIAGDFQISEVGSMTKRQRFSPAGLGRRMKHTLSTSSR